MKRVTILKKVVKSIEERKEQYACLAVARILSVYCNISYSIARRHISEIFPKFTYQYAYEQGFIDKRFYINLYIDNRGSWFSNNDNRISFLKHLIEIYKDDKTDIRRIIKKLKDNKN